MNRISQILKEKGFQELKPNKEILEKLGVKIHTWNKWVDNEKDPELAQLPTIAEFLNVPVADLIHKEAISHDTE